MAEGRSKQPFKTWPAGRNQVWRDGIEVVAMRSRPGGGHRDGPVIDALGPAPGR